MLNLDTGTAIAFIGEGSLQRYSLRSYVDHKSMIMTATALKEFRSIVEDIAGDREKARAERFLQRVQILADNPSDRALNLKPTRKLGDNDIIILGTGDKLGIITLTADIKAVKAALAQGVDFEVHIHPPYPLRKL